MLVKFSPEEARLWIDLYKSADELGIMRPIREGWVSFLAQEMRKGEFKPNATIAIAHYRDTVSIINGNHTLRAIVESGVTLELPVIEYRCTSLQEVRDLYATFDIGKSRTRSDSFRAYDATSVLGVKSITKSDVDALASAVKFMLNGFNSSHSGEYPRDARQISNRDLLQEMKPWASHYGELLGVVGNRDYKEWYNRIAKRRGVCSIAIATFRYQPEEARRFWLAITTGAGLKTKSPTIKLRDYLLTTNVMGGGRTSSVQVSADDMARVVAYCWNKYYRRETLSNLRIKYNEPVVILGTPIGAKSVSSEKATKGRAQLSPVPA